MRLAAGSARTRLAVSLLPTATRSVRPRAERQHGDPAALQQDDGQWVMPAKNYASTRFSGLDEINASNVSQPRRVVDVLDRHGRRATRRRRSSSAARCSSSRRFPNIVYAFDLSRPGAPMKWQYDPKPLGAAKGVACCDLVNRGAAYADGAIFFNTLDGRTIALDAATGQPKWITQLGDINKGETMTMAPLVVKGKVLVGNSGGEFGVRGWLAALDAASGSGRLARLQHRARQGRADRPELQAVLRGRPRHRPRDHDLAGRRRGGPAAARCGAGSPTTPSST